MFLRLRIRPQEPQTVLLKQYPAYRIRPSSFGVSLGLHALIVAVLLFNPMREPSGNARLYRDFIQPQEHKIIFYNFRKKLPEVAPAKKIGTGPKPRGLELSNQTLIAESPNAKSAKQFIWQPVPKIELPRDVKVPNLIARATAAPPPPPPAEAPKKAAPRKAFVPPPATRRAPEPVQVVMTDAPNALPSRMAPHDTSPTLKLRRTFLPPPPQAQSDRLGGPIMVDAPST